MQPDSTQFGSITIAGKTYPHDVIIRRSGKVEKRRKDLSKKEYGTSHTISKEEAKFVYEKGCRQLILGTGQYDNVRLSPEAADYLAKKGCEVIAKPTPEALAVYNELKSEKIALFHVTC